MHDRQAREHKQGRRSRKLFVTSALSTPPLLRCLVDNACAQTKKSLSGTKFRKMLRGGDDIPEWFAFKSVVDVLRAAN